MCACWRQKESARERTARPVSNLFWFNEQEPWNDLNLLETLTPLTPNNREIWKQQTQKKLVFRRCAGWVFRPFLSSSCLWWQLKVNIHISFIFYLYFRVNVLVFRLGFRKKQMSQWIQSLTCTIFLQFLLPVFSNRCIPFTSNYLLVSALSWCKSSMFV